LITPKCALSWFFRNRQTGAITVAQAPNLLLLLVVVATVFLWIRPSADKLGTVLNVVVTGGLLIWAADEIVRGVNPWRRCLGAGVFAYELTTIL
jgi:hypothetical protein